MEVEVQSTCGSPHEIWAVALIFCVAIVAGAWLFAKMFRD